MTIQKNPGIIIFSLCAESDKERILLQQGVAHAEEQHGNMPTNVPIFRNPPVNADDRDGLRAFMEFRNIMCIIDMNGMIPKEHLLPLRERSLVLMPRDATIDDARAICARL